MRRALCSLVAAGSCLLTASPALGAPGQAQHLGGMEAQGPASTSVTALHHNPAMLGALRSSQAHASFNGGIDQQWVRRSAIDLSTGAPTGELQNRISLLNPGVGYFAAGSLYFDPFAFGAGIYDLGSRYRFYSSESLRYHIAPDPDLGSESSAQDRARGGCLRPSKAECAPNGGAVDYRHDVTLALAWAAGALHLGAAVHFPMARARFAYDNDTALASSGPDNECTIKEDPACAERVGFKGWTHWIPRAGALPGFDFALTLGAAYQLDNERITLGARYRTFPLRRRGTVALSGVATVCRPEPGDGLGAVAPCERGETINATLSERMPQEVALGGSFELGRSKLWKIDTNLYWIDFCAGGARAGSCPDEGAQTLSLVGLDADSFVLPEFKRYRGRQDVYGIDLFTTYRARSNLGLTVAGHFNSPSVRPAAMTVVEHEGWRLGASLGVTVRVKRSNFLLTPGYGIDTYLPNLVGASEALFVPVARTDFEEAGADINAPGADAVLAGRARPSNAGRYFSMLHTLSIAVRWQERAQAR